MRKFSIFVVLFIISGILYSQNVPELMYYRFHNNTATTTFNFASAPVGTNPTPLVAGETFGSGGQFDSCLVATGLTTGYLNTGWATALPANWTISFWLGGGQVDMNPSYLFGDVNAASFRCFYGGAALANNLLLRGGSADVLVTGVNPTATVVTIVYNGTNTTVYKNGVLFNTFAVTFTNSGAGPFKVGNYGSGLTSFSGKMDEFRFYNRALTAAEVLLTWNTELGLASPLCEQFTSATFPPTGWTYVPGGTAYWIRNAASGFGLGSGSAQWDCWNGPSGTRQTMTTLQFSPATGTASSLNIDVAYQPFGTAPDSIILASSIDGGTTFTSLARLGPTQLATTTGNPSPFVPTASQWKKLNYVLPTGTNKLIIQGYSGFGDNVYLDSICVNYVPVGIGNNNNNVPSVYSLGQNYPNPFNPSTQISFGLPKSGNVKLVVFDVLGREVKTLVNEFQTAGTHNITFNASSLSSGVYFYTITANDFTATKKMLLVK